MKKILVVEDELSIAHFMSEVIRTLGYESKVLTSGKKVLSMAREWKPDLITLDLMMPAPDGLEVLSQLKDDPETQLIPVIVISVMANRADLASKLSHAKKIFSKPLDTKQFIESIQSIVTALPGNGKGPTS